MNKLPIKYHFEFTEKGKNHFYWKTVPFKKKHFVASILMPPPNITGNLHLGHCLDLTLQDFLVRYFHLADSPALWISGMDHAGIATQKKIESLNISLLKNAKEKKIYTLNTWYPQAKEKFFQQWEQLGLLVDYEKSKFTLDPAIQKYVQQSFIQLYHDGLIYRDKKLVNWDPQLKSVISDIEVEHKPSESKLYYLKYPFLNSSDYLSIATSRPETIFADVAVFVNPDDKRYQKYIGGQIQHPVTNQIIPVLADEEVLIEFGTGVLKCTPGHDFLDYKLGKKHNLPIVSCYDKEGKLNELASKWKGHKPNHARQEIIKELQERGICSKIEKYQTNLAISQRTGALVEPVLSIQWFLDLPSLIKKVEQKTPDFLNKINFHPVHFKQVIKNWKNITHEWCISRQLWWGHQIPAWYNKKSQEIYVGEESPFPINEWEAEKDVLDTWFSSGLWPITTINQGKTFPNPNLKYFPVTHLITGYDILFFWVLKMILLGSYFTNLPSFKNVYLHGLIRDKQGRKMSKSLGNGIEPEEIIEKNGSDSLRLFLLGNSILGSDLTYEESKIKGSYNFIQKLWSIGQFIILRLENYKLKEIRFPELQTELKKDVNKESQVINSWILLELQKLQKVYFEYGEKLETNYLSKKLIEFVWERVSNEYLELIKLDLSNNQATKLTLLYIYQQILLYMHPFIPFVTECLYQKTSCKSLLTSRIDKQIKELEVSSTKKIWIIDLLFLTIKSIRSFRQKHNIKHQIDIYCELAQEWKSKLDPNFNFNFYLLPLTKSQIRYCQPQETLFHIIELKPFGILKIPRQKTDLQKELQDKLAYFKAEYERAKNLLNNNKFTNKAPADLVNAEKQKLNYFAEQITKLSEKNKDFSY